MDTPRAGMDLWGGVECTVNRIGDEFFSQIDRSGHAHRIEDLERFASLGIRTLRYPVIWERVAPEGLDRADWSWSDQRLRKLRELGITPIVGLVHHGSGPRYTSLVDPAFPDKLAAYARAVAERYPWVCHYTPVNEPLTTARFSGLYGIWHPHARDEGAFKDMVFNQCRGTVLAMRAIQQLRPDARLVQTDDLGRTYSTPRLAYQARFNNELRWLCWDLLCGRVDERHFLWEWLTDRCGAKAEEIRWFADNPRPPDIVGINHYITSDRFLDHREDRYPASFRGGNGRHRYADVEASRALAQPTGGIAPLLEEAWARYRLPIAVTEAHIDATREDQMRWLAEIWAGAAAARVAGVDVRAVTFWGLLGCYDWNSLLTANRDYYEVGAFDVRGGEPRPTAVAQLARALASGSPADHPVLAGAGWWRRPKRFLVDPPIAPRLRFPARPVTGSNHAPILITGTGTLGQAFARVCGDRDLGFRLLGRSDMDIADAESVERVIEEYRPWAVINAAGYVQVDGAERETERCFRENTLGPATLALICARNDVPLVTFSSDLVFDGRQQDPYVETDAPSPLSVYGRSKAQAETQVLDRHPNALVVRTSSFFGPWDQHNFITVALRALRERRPFDVAHDVTVSPTYVPDLVNACLDLLIDGESGLWHLSNGRPITWAELALSAACLASVDASPLRPCRSQQMGLAAMRPRYSALGSKRSFAMPPLDDALGRYLRQMAMH